MANVQTQPSRKTPEPIPGNLRSVQPGGGTCYRIELTWGYLRRWYLRTLRPGYVARMAACRQGSTDGAFQPILDPRDLKFCRNQCTADWRAEDDPFAWRDNLGLARWGLAEVVLMTATLLAITALLAWLGVWYLAAVPLVVLGWVWWFFRDPRRLVPTAPGLVVSPADGTIAEVTPLEHDEFIGGPAVRIGIFLSIFNVHLNRSPVRARVIRLRYHPGKFLNALNPASAWENEALWIGLEAEDAPHRPMVVRQIAGLFARRIVCQLRTGEVIERGEKFGMIKLGSRTELILPAEPGLQVEVSVGQKVQAGSTIFARYSN